MTSEPTILITGATDGLGRYLAGSLAASGAQVIIHGRDPDRARRVQEEIHSATDRPSTDIVIADLADLHGVDQLAETVRERYSRLDVLVNNAGVGTGPPGSSRQTSADGIELRFAVNYLAGYYLTRRLTPLLIASAPARVVNVSSLGQRAIDFADPFLESSYSGVGAYRQSKLAQILFTVDLAEELREDGVTVNALHPATLMNTAMVRESGTSSVSTLEEGGMATLRLIRDPQLATVSGRFFNGTEPGHPHEQSGDPEARRRLRHLSDELISAALRAPRAHGQPAS